MTPTFNRRPDSRPFQATHRPRGSRKLVRFDAPSLPADLAGADWIQVADVDQRYSAVDLIELAVKAGTVVTIAHDERVTVPEWLGHQAKPCPSKLKEPCVHFGEPWESASIHPLRLMKKRSSAKSQKSSHDAALSVNPQWAWHYRTLSALRAHLMEEQQAQLQETSQPLEPVRTHLAERGADEFDRDLILTLLAREHNALAEVDAALERIQKGSYGICEMTGAPIPPERLRAVPWTRYVRAIEEQAEQTGHPPPFFPT